MKTVIALLLALALCVGLAACGARTLEAAIQSADKKLEKWNDEKYNGFVYSDMESPDGNYNIVVVDTLGGMNQTSIMLDARVKPIYTDLHKCFRGYDVDIGIVVTSSSGSILTVYTEKDLQALK